MSAAITRFLAKFVLPVAAGCAFVSGVQAASDGTEISKRAIAALCPANDPDPKTLAPVTPGAKVLSEGRIDFRGRDIGWRAILRLKDGSEIDVARIAPNGTLRRVSTIWAPPPKKAGGPALPALSIIAGPDCKIAHGRLLKRDDRGKPLAVALLGPDLKPLGRTELFDAPVPPGKDPGGVLVALIDSGVNYTLPQIAARLARDKDGTLLGYDYWDDDPRPFDADTGRSPFVAQRHGTKIASVLIREAPGARIVPYRYPRHEMIRFEELIAAADKLGVRIVGAPLGGVNRDHWAAFEEAVRSRPHMLFIVSAGNNGRDIDRRPIYPAALDLVNILTVTSATADGMLGRGSNWGTTAVDIMVPAERVDVIRFDGRPGISGGTSVAVPRVAALAARLLAKNPDWKAADLKAAILKRAARSPAQPKPVTRHGWIATPNTD